MARQPARLPSTNRRWPVGNRKLGNVNSLTTEDAEMAEGTIKKLTDKGFGFINTGGAKDLFFHSKSLQGVTFDALYEGQKVSYTEGRGPKGPCAENVTLI
jgi:CspA family cold shock protein